MGDNENEAVAKNETAQTEEREAAGSPKNASSASSSDDASKQTAKKASPSKAAAAGDNPVYILPTMKSENSDGAGLSKVGITLLASGLLLLVGDIYLGLLRTDVFVNELRHILQKKFVIKNSKKELEVFANPGDQMESFKSYYFFNVTNPHEIVIGKMPIVKEVGPFVYRGDPHVTNIEFHDNGTMSYNEYQFFYFVREKSIAGEDTIITNIDIPAVAAFYQASDDVSKLVLSAFVSCDGGGPFISMSVGEWTFRGKPHKVIAIANALKAGHVSIDAMNTKVTPNDTFGFDVTANGTLDARMNIYTGETGIDDVDRIHSVNHKTKLDVWPETGFECNKVDGIIGAAVPPLIYANTMKLYASAMCRPLLMKYSEDAWFGKVKVRRFVISNESLASSTHSAENLCYDKEKMFSNGIINIGPCKDGAPIVLSLPHFYRADEKYVKTFIGIHPNASLHEFYLDNEPITGKVIRGSIRIQINVALKGDAYCGLQWWDSETMVFPVMWSDMVAQAGPDGLSQLALVSQLPRYANLTFYGLLFLSLLLIAFPLL